jgi:SPP1 family predicted phage head-tail adaptor
MHAGELRHRIEIQENTPAKNSLGEDVDTWTTVNKRWAKVEPLTGRELQVQVQISADVTHRVTMRFYEGLTAKHRIRFNGRIFAINAVLNIEERDRETRVMCFEAPLEPS